jgi:inner membrane protein
MTDAEPEPAAPVRARPAPRTNLAGQWLRTPAAKVGMILGLLLIMQVPLMMVGGLIQEREQRQSAVLAGFRRGWGPDQSIVGPMLVVPYSWAKSGSPGERLHGWARLPASRLNVVATLQPEERRRGLFHAIVYTASVELAGAITVSPLAISDPPDAAIDWNRARVVLGASDLRGMPPDATIDWGGRAVQLQASSIEGGCGLALLDAPAGSQAAPGATIPFRATLTLRGTQAFRMVQAGRQIDMRIASSWPTPSFTGATLPLRYDLHPDGFNAHWEMAGGPSNSDWQLVPNNAAAVNSMWMDTDAQVGVELQEAVPTYLMVDRAAKYSVFFLALSYLTLFLFEALSGVRIHLVQYGMVGLSLSLFALLLISIAEPLGFTISYAISAAAIMAQASLYTLSVVGRRLLAAVFAGVLGTLFGFLYVVLSLDAYALLVGTIGLFAVLSVVMVATRRVNWAAAPIAS